ncbi:hypothetical protein BU25DRAFT_350991 [Macroventuria anomochaeta]|uniref:Uncharacterized protein n=1 Tax=Macroventuria anomochaeta TaxID=301207 RepID=A0ACB6RM83_9PLEO|nr:uncharacterized protein BU25DRAFT_350991 [Macroventuria anomochaeta]KAF2622981.1 hypothetical protein BU25DRAFT_350991 [Macroventuria anomochaeta]
MANELAPPRKSVELEDPGAKELVDSENEHFSDASEGRQSRAEATSPIPITRVERVDDEPAHGEVPGTAAYKMRTQDAVPDEVEIVPDGQRSRSTSRVSASDRPLTPGGTPIPKTVVEKIDPDQPGHGDVPGTLAHQQRLADAAPDVIVKAPEPPKRDNLEGSPTASIDRSPIDDDTDSADDTAPLEADDFPEDTQDQTNDASEGGEAEEDDGFGDFDEFEEGGEGDDDDFGDFDDGFQQGEEQAETTFGSPQNQTPVPAPPQAPPGPPVLHFAELTSLEAIIGATQPYVDEIYPTPQDLPSISTGEDTRSIFHSERSHSLWTQLVAPPPLQPPDWVRSRIRRLFLVSLGVPVDLDEILPASKQKKLVLPSINIPGDKSPRPSSDGRSNALDRVKKDNASNTSVDSSKSKTERPRKGPPLPPFLDLSATSMLCATTEAALLNFTDDELKIHVDHLKGLHQRAEQVFEYWQKQLESALGDKDAFEQVIESLVAHAKKLR